VKRAGVVAGPVARQAARQRAFDAAIAEGFASGSSELSLDEIMAYARRWGNCRLLLTCELA
jgi:hypothetical protein